MKAPLISVLSLASASALALMLGLAATPAQAAVMAVDLTVNNSGTITDGTNGVTVVFDKLQPSGTGVLDPFLRITSQGSATNEQGYNTSASPPPFDDIAGIHTHDVLFSTMQAVGGFYNFVLDIGEPKGGTQELLSLDGLKLYAVSAGGQFSASVDGAGNASGIIGTNGITGTLLWDMDAGIDNYILLDADRGVGGPGNGISDMLMQVPTSVFAGVNTTATPNFILWSRFGLQEGALAGSAAQGTFEEWAQLKNGNGGGGGGSIPEPASLLLMGAGLMGLGLARRRKSA